LARTILQNRNYSNDNNIVSTTLKKANSAYGVVTAIGVSGTIHVFPTGGSRTIFSSSYHYDVSTYEPFVFSINTTIDNNVRVNQYLSASTSSGGPTLSVTTKGASLFILKK
jgi:hypothetical protein